VSQSKEWAHVTRAPEEMVAALDGGWSLALYCRQYRFWFGGREGQEVFHGGSQATRIAKSIVPRNRVGGHGSACRQRRTRGSRRGGDTARLGENRVCPIRRIACRRPGAVSYYIMSAGWPTKTVWSRIGIIIRD